MAIETKEVTVTREVAKNWLNVSAKLASGATRKLGSNGVPLRSTDKVDQLVVGKLEVGESYEFFCEELKMTLVVRLSEVGVSTSDDELELA